MERMASPRRSVGKGRSYGKIHVLLVDDHAMVGQGLRSMPESYPEIEVVGECLSALDPDIVIVG